MSRGLFEPVVPGTGVCLANRSRRSLGEGLSPAGTYHKEMAPGKGGRGVWWGLLAAIVSAGLLSRFVHTGFRLFDKYLGDSLYAAMVYVLFRLTGRVARVTLWASVTMTAIEFFQLTQVPAEMFRSRYLVIHACGRLLGTEFSVFDLLAYSVGIGCIAVIDHATSNSGLDR